MKFSKKNSASNYVRSFHFLLVTCYLSHLPHAAPVVVYEAALADKNPASQGWTANEISVGSDASPVNGFIDAPANAGPVSAAPQSGQAWQLRDQSSAGSLNLPGYEQALTNSEIAGLLSETGFIMTFEVRAKGNHNTKFANENWSGFFELSLPAEVLPGTSGRRIGFAIGIGSNNNFQVFNEQDPTPLSAGSETSDEFHTIKVFYRPGESLYYWSLNDTNFTPVLLQGGPQLSPTTALARFSSGSSNAIGGAFDILSFQITERPSTLYVDADATGSDIGTSWVDAFDDLQDALATAGAGDEIWVARGTYYPDEGLGTDIYDGEPPSSESYRRLTSNLKSGVAVYGGFVGTETMRSERNSDPRLNFTVLSGKFTSGGSNIFNAYHVVTASGVGASAILDGFTVRDGNASGEPTVGEQEGGGLLIKSNSSPQISNCRFRANTAEQFGGAAAILNSSSPVFSNCSFVVNTAGLLGGAIYNDESSATFTECEFDNNSANSGGAIFNLQSSPSISHSTFSENSSSSQGGAIYNANSFAPSLVNCLFESNDSSNGGAISNQESSPSFSNCAFLSNTARSSGGAIFNSASSPAVINSTLRDNDSANLGGAFYNADSSPSLTNSIIWENSASGLTTSVTASVFNQTASSQPIYSHCLIANSGGSATWNSNIGTDNGSNIDTDPNFVSETGAQLEPGSPAQDAGDNAANSTSADIEGNVRIIGRVIDIGAYEIRQVELGPPEQRVRLSPDELGSVPSVFPDITNLGSSLDYSLIEIDRAGSLTFEGTPDIDRNGGLLLQLEAGSSGTLIYRVQLRDPSGEFLASPNVQLFISIGGELRVDKNISGGAGDGSSWADAFTHLQDAIAAADPGDEIWVAQGTYFPDEGAFQSDDSRFSTFELKDGIALYGGFSGTETNLSDRNPNLEASKSILSGDLDQNDGPDFTNNSQNAYNVVKAIGTGASTILDGLEISHGNANAANDINLRWGGGLFNASSSLKVSNCVFKDNFAADQGGAMLNGSSGSTVINCLFTDNASGANGGAIYNFNFQGRLVNCTMVSNAASAEGGAIYNRSDTLASITNCIVWNNAASGTSSSSSASVFSESSGPEDTYSHCLIENSGGSSAWNDALGVDLGSNIDADPMFVSANNFRLGNGSPALNSGDNSSNLSQFDLAGNSRIQDRIIDLGAYEGAAVLANFALLYPSLDPQGDDNDNGQSNYLDYALGGDPTAAFDPDLQPSISNGQLTFSFRTGASDVFVEFQKSETLLPGSWSPMIPGTDYTISTEEVTGSVKTQTLDLLTTEPELFFREAFSESAF